jgi:beta-N-acetylhexosaminidase
LTVSSPADPAPLPAIVGLSGQTLLPPERALLRRYPPAGIILFARNIADPRQLAALITDLREILPGAGLMVDHEGGRVARLRPPHWQAHPPARAIGDLHARDPAAGQRAAWITGALIGAQCRDAGFDVTAAPVLDVADPAGHSVIGDRAFSADPHAVAALGEAMARGLLAAGMQPIGKHAPGHGRARVDSHLELPELDDVSDADLIPFAANAWLPWMMTAHIRYTARDMQNPATQSPALVRLIRGLGFDGVLTTDDLAMHALTGPPGERAARALAAGCDIALHCSGVLAETESVLTAVPPLTAAARARLDAATAMAAISRIDLDIPALSAERVGLLS